MEVLVPWWLTLGLKDLLKEGRKEHNTYWTPDALLTSFSYMTSSIITITQEVDIIIFMLQMGNLGGQRFLVPRLIENWITTLLSFLG